ncbi:MAG: hypothetical protein ABGY75_19675 [Gemmataceae bacterium]
MTDPAVLDRPAEAPAAAAPPSGPLADLILVRLLPPVKNPPAPGVIQKDLAPLFHTPPSAEQVKETLKGLQAAELVFPKKRMLTDAGRERALAYLGISELPAKVNFRTIKAKFLVPKALGLSAKAVENADKLASVPLKRKLGLPVGTGDTLNAVLDAIACRELGFPDKAKVNFRDAIVSKSIGEAEPLSKDDLQRVIPGKLLQPPPGRGVDRFRKLALKGFADAADGTPVQQPEPQPDETFDLEDFANTVLSVARKSPTGRFGDNKVFISHVWRQLHDEPRFARLGLDGFKAKLVEANRADLLTLSRADLVQVMDPADVRESETAYLNATFHFIRINQE